MTSTKTFPDFAVATLALAIAALLPANPASAQATDTSDTRPVELRYAVSPRAAVPADATGPARAVLSRGSARRPPRYARGGGGNAGWTTRGHATAARFRGNADVPTR